MRTIEQIRQLSQNPFYKLTAAERQMLEQADGQSQDSTDTTSKKRGSVKGNAVVKETGKLNKHSTDPVSE